jgi:hypothetical protein
LNDNQRDLWHPPKGLPPIKKPTLPNRIKVKTRHPYISALPPSMKPDELEGADTRTPTHIHHIISWSVIHKWSAR